MKITNKKRNIIHNKIISIIIVFTLVLSFINCIKLNTNTFAKNINIYSYDYDYYESYEPIEASKYVRAIFSKYNIDNDDNLLMVGCNKDYILDFRLVGNAIGIVRDLAFGGYYICYGNEEDLKYAKMLLESDPNIEYAEKNEVLYLEDDLDTNEINANLLTNEESDLDINDDEVLKDIKIREYIDKIDDIFKTRKVKVGIISSGIYKDHELFQGVIEGGYDFCSEDDNLEDNCGDGTNVSGIIANALKGLNYKITPYKVYDNDDDETKKGKEDKKTTRKYRLCQAIKQAITDNCNVINVGLFFNMHKGMENGSYHECKYDNDGFYMIHSIVEKALNAGICVVAPVGNTRINAENDCPAHMQYIGYDKSMGREVNHDIISVGEAVKKYEGGFKRANYSNYGDMIDLHMLSGNIITADKGGKYIKFSHLESGDPRLGSAYVSAMAAVLKAISPKLTSKDIEDKLKENAINFNDGDFESLNYKLATFENMKVLGLEPVHRLYNKITGEHYYTINENEMIEFTKTGWKYEGIKWYSPTEEKEAEKIGGAVGVYKLYNKKLDRHLFTIKQGEIRNLRSSGWEVENDGNPVFYSCGDIEIYRVYNPNDGDHLLTTSETELGKLVKLGWIPDAKDTILKTIRTKEKK